MRNDSIILRTDSYKASHFLQYPPGTEQIFSYVESRGGPTDWTLFFGLQAIIKEYFLNAITMEDVDLAEDLLMKHGVPFNRAGWERIVTVHSGRLPIEIRALAEGTIVPTHTPLFTVVNTDPELPWLTSYVETLLLRAWYPTTVATISKRAKNLIKSYLDLTSDNPDAELPFKLHDFGSRGVSSEESAGLGGMAHMVNFSGSDTLAGICAAQDYYDANMPAFSIPAAEHSTITSWGRDHEADAYRNMIEKFSKPGSIYAVVSDSYDLFNAIKKLWGGELKQQVIDSGGTLVVRPDSGYPADIVMETLKYLEETFGATINNCGFKVLNHVRVIQGDGVDLNSIEEILDRMMRAGYSATNIAFGMGGALLQKCNRDTYKFAYKTSAAKVAGAWRDVYKDPVTDQGKRSKAGIMTVVQDSATVLRTHYCTSLEDAAEEYITPFPGMRACVPNAMATVYRNGKLLINDDFDLIRERSND